MKDIYRIHELERGAPISRCRNHLLEFTDCSVQTLNIPTVVDSDCNSSTSIKSLLLVYSYFIQLHTYT